MYDPTIGRWLTKDPIEFEGGRTNLYQYCGNDPTNLTDPTGLADIKLEKMVSAEGLAINPVMSKTRSGSRWMWSWGNDDARFIVQQVTDSGTFSVWVKDAAGQVYKSSATWSETYTEAWAKEGTSRENHIAGPKQPAQYLEEKTGCEFITRNGQLFLKDKKTGAEWEVVKWTFEMKAQFKARNGSFRNWDPPVPANSADHIWTTAVNFRVGELIIDDKRTEITSSTTFRKMLYPGVSDSPVPGFPPDTTIRDLEVVCNDTWTITWTAGQKHPTGKYTTSGYHVAGGR